MEWLKAPKPDFDFLTFEEAERVVLGAKDEWRTMVLVALRTEERPPPWSGKAWSGEG
jgi:hypothetical protein